MLEHVKFLDHLWRPGSFSVNFHCVLAASSLQHLRTRVASGQMTRPHIR
jgi:hypothetical protein